MRARTFGLLLLALVGVAPLIAFGLFAITRAERAAISEARDGNARLARNIARRIGSYTTSERTLIRTIGSAALMAPTRADADALLDAFALSFLHVHDLAVYKMDGSRWAGGGEHAALAAGALSGAAIRGDIVPAGTESGAPFAHTVPIAEPVVTAGRQEGAVVARIDLVGLWEPVNRVKVGASGFVRLLSTSGELLAHGDPEERRHVYDPDRQVDARLVARALLGQTGINQQGEEVVASVALVPQVDGILVVEQAVSEAFAAASAVRRDLFLWVGGALVFVVLAGLLLGRVLVRGLERLRRHTQVLARGELDAKADPQTLVTEVRALATALDDMAESLQKLQDEARQRERLDTFARVAAGLAHDLRQPVEAMRMAAETVIESNGTGSDRELLVQVARRDLPKLVRYVEDLRRLAHWGDLRLEVERISPREVAEHVAGDLSAHPKYSGVQFQVVGEAADLTADPRLVERAVANLAQNGADACLESGGGRTVTIEVAESRTGPWIEFRVSDEGSGIAPDRIADLLKADFRSTKRSHGIGLGLGVVRQVAESHRGRLELASQVGEGSTFSLVLPKEGPTDAQEGRSD